VGHDLMRRSSRIEFWYFQTAYVAKAAFSNQQKAAAG